MGDPTHHSESEQQLVEWAQTILQARAELRAERAAIQADRVEVDRLLNEARAAHHEANRERKLARKAAARFARHLEHTNSTIRGLLEADAAQLVAERKGFAAEVAQLNAIRTEFHTAAAATRDRLREAWENIETQQKRAAEEWAEAARYFTEQTASLDARAVAVEQREQQAATRLARAEADTAGLQEEAAALEQRVQNARGSLAELEQRREQVRTELLSAAFLPNLLPAGPNADDFQQRELLLQREKAAVAVLHSSLERESAGLSDSRRLVAEQLSQLADARVRWQRAERQTVIEMEELALALRQRETSLDTHEQRLIRADARRREDAYALWQLRLRLESWQSKLTALELRSHTEREQLGADLERRSAVVIRREAALGAVFARWEQARRADHARLRAEVEHWADDRQRASRAIADFERIQQELAAELAAHAARALAAEQLVSEAMHDAGSQRITRRLALLRKRWERLFARKLKEIAARRSELAGERAAVEDRYSSLHERLSAVEAREAGVNERQAAAELAALTESLRDFPPAPAANAPEAPSAELVALRAEVERLAVAMLEMKLPESPGPKTPLPLAAEVNGTPPQVLQFGSNDSQAA